MSSIQKLEQTVTEKFSRLGWDQLTPIQSKAYPVILRQRNALLVAPTGSGKTEAAIVPIIAFLAKESRSRKGIRAIYITPLRALNRDIFRRVLEYAKSENLSAAVRHGDTPTSVRRKITENPPDLLITTPETLAILLTGKRSREGLATVRWVIIDELHELISSERGTHLSLSLERLEKISDSKIVRVGLSATVGNLDVASKFLAGKRKSSAVLVDHSIRNYEIDCKCVDGSLVDVSDFILRYVSKEIGQRGTSLLFTNTRVEAESIGAILKAKSQDILVDVHHGSLSKETREDTESRLRSGEAGIVVCTSSLELGLDVGAVSLVIQLGSPRQAVKLIQRMGRSRHRVGATAKGLLVTNSEDDELEALALIDRVSEMNLEPSYIHENAHDVVAHQAVGMAIERGRVSLEEVVHIFENAYPFKELTSNDVEESLILLDRQGVIRFDGGMLRMGGRTFQYYYENISTIPDLMQFQVIDITKKKIVGRLDQMFVGEYGEPGKSFVLRGNSWRIVSIDDEKRVMHVEPMLREISTIPHWIGELIPVDLETAKRVGKMRRQVLSNSESRTCERQMKRLKETRDTLQMIPDESNIVIENKIAHDVIVIHCCFGSRINQTLATVLSVLISSKTGFMVDAKSDPYRIILSSQGNISTNDIESSLNQDLDLKKLLSVAVIGTHPLNWKTWYVAKKFGIIKKDSQYDRRAARLIQNRYRNTPLYREVMRELMLEKYDIERTRIILDELKKGKIMLHKKDVREFSELTKPILEHATRFAALPLTVEKSILDLVKERLEGTRSRLVCMSCGKWEAVITPRDVGDTISCSICRSRLVANTYLGDYDLIKIVQKKRGGKSLKREEEICFRKAWKTSSLIQNFGRRAVLVRSGFGIGPDTAARILRKSLDDDEFLKNVYFAEKTYVTTRGFWKDK